MINKDYASPLLKAHKFKHSDIEERSAWQIQHCFSFVQYWGFFGWLCFFGFGFGGCYQVTISFSACCYFRILKIVKKAVGKDFKSSKYRGYNL